MKYTESSEYSYEFYWVRYKGKVTIGELRSDVKPEFKYYKITGEVLNVFETDLEVLRRVEDYDDCKQTVCS